MLDISGHGYHVQNISNVSVQTKGFSTVENHSYWLSSNVTGIFPIDPSWSGATMIVWFATTVGQMAFWDNRVTNTNSTSYGPSLIMGLNVNGIIGLGGSSAGTVTIGINGDNIWSSAQTSTAWNDGHWHMAAAIWNPAGSTTANSSQFSIVVDGVQQNVGTFDNQSYRASVPFYGVTNYSLNNGIANPNNISLAHIAFLPSPVSVGTIQQLYSTALSESFWGQY